MSSNEERLKIIKSLIEDSDPDIKPNVITAYSISKSFNISFIESTILLNQFIIEEPNIDDYVLFFLCDIVDETKKVYSKIIISSFDKNVNKILEDKKHTLSFGIFAICQATEFCLIKNYLPFVGDNNLIERFDFSNVPKDVFIGLKEIKVEEPQKKNNEKSTIQPAKKKTNESQKENKSFEKKQTKINTNKILADEDENYYGDFVPNPKAKTDKPKGEQQKINLGRNTKRKKGNRSDSSESSHSISDEENNKRKVSQEKINEVIEEKMEEDVKMEDKTEEKAEQPKKIRKTRMVKHTKTFMDEDGYLVTKDIMEEEEYWVDAEQEKKKRSQPVQVKQETKKQHKKGTKERP